MEGGFSPVLQDVWSLKVQTLIVMSSIVSLKGLRLLHKRNLVRIHSVIRSMSSDSGGPMQKQPGGPMQKQPGGPMQKQPGAPTLT